MSGVNATLNGLLVTDARVSIPAWGCWYADASVDGEKPLAGRVELKVSDLTLSGTILSGGPTGNGRSHFRIVSGAGGWGKELPKKSYANDAEVKLRTILVDAAREAGETLDITTVPATRVGSHFARPEGAASRSLELYASSSWYVGEDGITRLGQRSASTLPAGVTHAAPDLARGMVTLASDSIAKILPGVVVDGLTAVDVEHTISASGGLRSTVWGARGAGSSRMLSAFKKMIDALYPQLAIAGVWEYRVVTQSGKRLNLQPVRVSTGMPDLERVMIRPGIAGVDVMVKPGARVLVTFLDGEPGRPAVVNFEEAEGGGFLPLMTHIDALQIKLLDGARPVVLAADMAGIFPCAATTTIARLLG